MFPMDFVKKELNNISAFTFPRQMGVDKLMN